LWSAICGHFGFGFVQEIEQDELTFDGWGNHVIENGLPEVHSFEDLLEDIVDDVSEDKRVIDITILPFELVLQKSTPWTREGFDYLGGRDQDVGLHDEHRGFMGARIFFVVI